MMKKINLYNCFRHGFSMYLSNGLPILKAQENIKSKYSNATTTNITKIFGEPIYRDKSSIK